MTKSAEQMQADYLRMLAETKHFEKGELWMALTSAAETIEKQQQLIQDMREDYEEDVGAKPPMRREKIEQLKMDNNTLVYEVNAGLEAGLENLPDKFPSYLRKMWSGGEVVAWLESEVNDILQNVKGRC
jgi:hypothetical protein